MSNSLQPHGLQKLCFPVLHYSSSLLKFFPLSQLYYLAISSSAAFFFAFNLTQHLSLFQQVSSSHQWPKYWSFSFSISPSSKYLWLTSFRIDWFDLLAVQGTLKSLLQLHNSKASILRWSAFFIVQLSHLYMTTGKTMVLITRQCLFWVEVAFLVLPSHL